MLGSFDPYLPRHLTTCVADLLEWTHENLAAPFWRLYLAAGAGGQVRFGETGGEWRDLLPSHIYLIPPETPFASRATRPFRQFYTHFQVPASRHAVPGVTWIALEITRDLPRHERLPRDIRHGHYPTPRQIPSLLCDALACVPQGFFDSPLLEPELRLVVDYLHEHLHEGLSNEMLAKIAGLSPNGLTRKFQEQLHTSPQQYLREKRLQKACLLLRHGTGSIEEIAAATGFSDRYHFSKVFRKYRRISPAAFRRIKA